MSDDTSWVCDGFVLKAGTEGYVVIGPDGAPQVGMTFYSMPKEQIRRALRDSHNHLPAWLEAKGEEL